MSAFNEGFAAGKRGATWFSCPYTGMLMRAWLDGYDAGRNALAIQRENVFCALGQS